VVLQEIQLQVRSKQVSNKQLVQKFENVGTMTYNNMDIVGRKRTVRSVNNIAHVSEAVMESLNKSVECAAIVGCIVSND
jgi:uncharacterized protein involved in propanediol utilization